MLYIFSALKTVIISIRFNEVNQIMISTQIAVVGGSLAGSFSAFLLAKQGHKVTLITTGSPHNSKACGEGLSIIGHKQLKSAGLWNGTLESSAMPFFGYYIKFPDNKTANLESNTATGYTISRKIIDQHVMDAAIREPNVSLINEKAISCRNYGDHWEIICENSTIKANYLIVGSGRVGRTLVETIDTSQNSKINQRYGFTVRARGKWSLDTPKQVIIENHKDRQLLLTPLAHDHVNISLLINRKDDISRKRTKSEMIKETLGFAERCGFTNHILIEYKGATQISSSHAANPIAGAYLVGDTAEVFDPIGGMGMSHALISASLAAQSINRSIKNPISALSIWKRFRVRHQVYATFFRFYTSLSYSLNVRSNKVISTAVRLFPGLSIVVFQKLASWLPIAGMAKSSQSRFALCGVKFNKTIECRITK